MRPTLIFLRGSQAGQTGAVFQEMTEVISASVEALSNQASSHCSKESSDHLKEKRCKSFLNHRYICFLFSCFFLRNTFWAASDWIPLPQSKPPETSTRASLSLQLYFWQSCKRLRTDFFTMQPASSNASSKIVFPCFLQIAVTERKHRSWKQPTHWFTPVCIAKGPISVTFVFPSFQ